MDFEWGLNLPIAIKKFVMKNEKKTITQSRNMISEVK